MFVTVNETDGQGRRRENIFRARALYADADNADQFNHALDVLRKTGAKPTMAVQTSQNRAHFYSVATISPSNASRNAKPHSRRNWGPTPPSRIFRELCG